MTPAHTPSHTHLDSRIAPRGAKHPTSDRKEVIPLPEITSVTIHYRVELEDFTVNVSETYRPKRKPKREPEKEAPEPKQRPER